MQPHKLPAAVSSAMGVLTALYPFDQEMHAAMLGAASDIAVHLRRFLPGHSDAVLCEVTAQTAAWMLARSMSFSPEAEAVPPMVYAAWRLAYPDAPPPASRPS